MSNALMCATIDSIAQWGFGVQTNAMQSVAVVDRCPLVDVRAPDNRT